MNLKKKTIATSQSFFDIGMVFLSILGPLFFEIPTFLFRAQPCKIMPHPVHFTNPGVLGLRKGSLATDLLTWAFEHEDGKNPFCMSGAEIQLPFFPVNACSAEFS